MTFATTITTANGTSCWTRRTKAIKKTQNASTSTTSSAATAFCSTSRPLSLTRAISLTTADEFNLATFIQGGYGKHISLLKQENRAFKDKEDFTNEEKQRIVLQSLLMLAYVAKARAQLCTAAGATLYHRPLLLALVNSVNTEDADLKLFFRELERIGNGEISPQAFTAAKNACAQNLQPNPNGCMKTETFTFDHALFDSLTLKDSTSYVFQCRAAEATWKSWCAPPTTKSWPFKLKSPPPATLSL